MTFEKGLTPGWEVVLLAFMVTAVLFGLIGYMQTRDSLWITGGILVATLAALVFLVKMKKNTLPGYTGREKRGEQE